MLAKAVLKSVIPKSLLGGYFAYRDRRNNPPPKKIIEHMEVDFALSRVVDKRLLRILDIGSHHGEFLDIFGTFNHWHNWQVFCVEPLAQNRREIEKKIKKYPNVKASILPIGVSDVSEVKTFYLGHTDTLFTCNQNWVQSFSRDFKDSRSLEIRCLTVDDMASEFGIERGARFDLVKIDVEGHDANVIQSFCDSSLSATALMFEVSLDMERIDECMSMLRAKGFDEFVLFGRTGIPTSHIGEVSGPDEIHQLFKSGKIGVGNIVAFSR
ncbi:FkbM family methyltransferase [Herbaspirillum sp. LeCh32-8]|uniref:FkbM family methyltransferase n=1 Tax=Herbaspirillum sp. LeCh32-8 TaxID=2821356 RepID=UPI001AEAB65B|nr:FkbM family methyltransferase [Herbaspirillum sp. LeCh32-8]MBP0597950.1 FkbM family methyltransferase [Herbaspirillum sp. LeCh32-8]